MDEQLLTKVFPKMVSDNISFVAKSGILIKAFGFWYLKCYKAKHLVAVVSQKITLTPILIAMRFEINTIHSLQDCLSLKYFEAIVKCTKKLAPYNPKKDNYGFQSIILKLKQSLKQCCDIAEFILLKESDSLLVNKNEK